MNLNLKRKLSIAALACSIAMPVCAVPGAIKPDLTNYMLKSRHHESSFATPANASRLKTIETLQARMDARRMVKAPVTNDYKPSFEATDMNYLGDLDAPDGSLWFYYAHNTYEKIVHESEFVHYTEYILQTYTFDIYNDKMEFVGSISDKYEYAPGEVRVVLAELAPSITKNFFNNDDKFEVMVNLSVNTDVYVNNNYLRVYSLDGEKKDGLDVPIASYNTLLGDVLNASTPTQENVYMTFISEGNDYEPKDENDDLGNIYVNFWEKYLSYYVNIETYAKAPAGTSQPVKVFEKKLPLAQLPGDMSDAPLFFSGIYNGKPLFVTNYYEQPFFNRYDSYDEETTQREGNNLVIEILEPAGDKLVNIQTTKIPAILDDNADVISTFYSVGSFKYREDVNFTDYDTEGKAAFFITKANYLPSSDNYVNSYYVYNPDGTCRMTLFEEADGHISMSNIKGCDAQELFVYIDYSGEYMFDFINLRTGKTELEMSYLLDTGMGEPEYLTLNLDRVATADGSYEYVSELRVPAMDENNNDIMRVVRFSKDGTYIATDEMNMGQGIQYAQCYIAGEALDPTFFHSDSNREYMMLVKRSNGNDESLQEELLILQAITPENPQGETLLNIKPDETHGNLANIYPVIGNDGNNKLVVTFKKEVESQEIFSHVHYDLPLDKASGVGSVVTATGNTLAVDGSDIVAPGEEISLFNVQGALVSRATGRLSVSGLATGVYIARAAGASLKFFVK